MGYFSFNKVNAQNIEAISEYHDNNDEAKLQTESGIDDYFFQAGSDTLVSGVSGRAAQALGMKDVRPGDYEKLFKGINPRTEESFVDDKRRAQIDSGDSRAVYGYSTSVNVDKSISLLYASSSDHVKRAMEAAMMRASDATVDYMNKSGIFRSRKGRDGVETIRGDTIALRYLHFTSRNQEPHLHVHLEIPNTMLCADGEWRTLDGQQIYNSQHEIASIFDSYLAQELSRSKEIAPHLQRKMGVGGLTIAGIPEETINKFSTRNQEIEQIAEEIGNTSFDARRSIATNYRKLKDIKDPQELKQFWRDQIGHLELEKADNKLPSKLDIEAELFRGKSVFYESDFRRVAAQLSILNGGPDKIYEIQKELIEQMGIVEIPGRTSKRMFTTKDMIDMESDILNSAVHGQNAHGFKIQSSDIKSAIELYQSIKDFELTDEQREATYRTSGDERVTVIQGAAGVGKSATLASVNFAYVNAGFRVLGVAPSGAAAAELASSAQVKSQTIHSLLIQIEQGQIKLSNKDVLMVDEAAMVDTRIMHALFKHTAAAGTKMILVGDEKQLESIASANCFSVIHNAIGKAEITKIARQKGDYRPIAQNWFEGKHKEALAAMRKKNMVIGADNPATELVNTLAKKEIDWKEDLALADNNKDVTKLNDLIRELRKSKNELGESIEFQSQFKDYDARTIELAVNDRIMLRDNAKINGDPVFNGDRGVIESVENGNIMIRLDRTNEVIHLPEDYTAVTHSYAMTVHKAQGLTVDRAYYLASEMTNQRSMYVAYTRGREGAQVFHSMSEDFSLDAQCSITSEKITALDAINGKGFAFENRLHDLVFSDQPGIFELMERDKNQSIEITDFNKMGLEAENTNDVRVDPLASVAKAEQMKELLASLQDTDADDPVDPEDQKYAEFFRDLANIDMQNWQKIEEDHQVSDEVVAKHVVEQEPEREESEELTTADALENKESDHDNEQQERDAERERLLEEAEKNKKKEKGFDEFGM